MAAIVAAFAAQGGPQGPSKQGSSSDRSLRSVFVGNIPYEASEEQLKEIFSEVGPVVSFRLVFDRETGKPKGYGFCEYKDQETALSAMRNLNGYELNGRALRVDSAASEKNKEEMKGMEGAARPEVSPYGPPVAPEEAPEAITQAVASLPPEQMFELMKQMKICIQNNPEEARQMLLQNPQLAYALLQAQVVMKIVDPVIAQNLLHRNNDPVAPLQTGAPQQNPLAGPGPGPMAGGPGPMNQGPPGQFQPGPGPDIRGPLEPRGPDMRGPQEQWGPSGADGRGPDRRGPPDMRGLPPDRGPGGMHGPPDRGPGGMHGPPDRGPGGMHGPPDRGPGGMHGPPDRGPGGMHGSPDRGPGGMHGPPDRGPGDFRGPPQEQGFGAPRDRRMFDQRDPRSRDPPRDDRRDDRRGSMAPRDHPRDPRGGPSEQHPGGSRFGPSSGPRDPRGDRGPMPSDGRFQGPGHSPQPQWGPPQGGPPQGGAPQIGPDQGGFNNAPGPAGQGGDDVTAQDQEKAALIMQVLSLTDQQIALLPEDQRQSIMVLKEQIARSAT